MNRWSVAILSGVFIVLATVAYQFYQQQRCWRNIAERLQAESRRAEILVLKSVPNPDNVGRVATTLKFLEYDSQERPLPAKILSFSDNLIHFRALVVRFEDRYVRQGDALRGKSVMLFDRAFVLDGANTEEVVLTPLQETPQGYQLQEKSSSLEQRFWERFWQLALHEEEREKYGIKQVQLEAPATKFMPGYLYTLKIEHDGGVRIDSQKLSKIFE